MAGSWHSSHSEHLTHTKASKDYGSLDKKPLVVEEDDGNPDDEWLVDEGGNPDDEWLDPPQGCCGHLFPAGYKQEAKATMKILYGLVCAMRNFK